MARTSMQYDMTRDALRGVTDHHTITAYKKDIKQFVGWAKENGYGKEELGKETIQEYTNKLINDGYSPTTIHRYIAPVCKALDVNMSEIDKPRRTSGAITRSRSETANKQGKKEAQSTRFERIVKFQEAVGIRRTELVRLKTDCLKTDETGHLCVLVERGKGGKTQLQRVLPQYEEVVKKTVAEATGERVFSSKETSNKIDFHSMRAGLAREAYSYYKDRLEKEPSYRKQLQIQLEKRWKMFHIKPNEKAFKRFKSDLTDDRPYEVARANKERAMEHGTPLRYDRLAVMAVSVFHLSHWRLDVTITNYLV